MATTFSYNPSLSTDRDRVRFLIGDTNEDSPKYQDQEIDWALSVAPNVFTAAADLCDQLVTQKGNIRSKKISGLSITYDPTFYKTLSGTLRARGMSNQVPYAGGVSVADKQALRNDTDIVQPTIVRNMDDNPLAPGRSTPPINPTEQN